MTQRSNLLLTVTVGSILLLFTGLVVIMWRIGFFTFNGTDPSSKVVAAALALVGTFTGTVVSIVGILLKHSIDQQTAIRQEIESNRNATLQRDAEQRLKLDSERNAVLQNDAEQRLKLEAAVRALQLFSTSTGTPTPMTQRDGALFALDSLGQYELTLLMTDSLLEKGELSPATATALLDHALVRGSREVKVNAISLLNDHAARMITPLGVEMPDSLIDWTPDLPDYVREWAPIAMSKVLMARPVAVWMNQFRYSVNAFIAALCMAWQKEQVPRLKINVGVILNEIFKAFPHVGGKILYHSGGEVDVDNILQKVAESTSADTHATEMAQQLAHWRQARARSADASSS